MGGKLLPPFSRTSIRNQRDPIAVLGKLLDPNREANE